MATLSRKYRPKTFKEVLGQNHIKASLESEIMSNDLAQAYLFCGPRAVGKTTLARILAKSINCLERKDNESEPCNNCSSCVNINKNKSLEVIEIDGASHTGVDNVRENIIETARISPSNSKFKVFIIDEVHMLSISAFNALLKVIEEPPKQVLFILCTTEVHKVPSTVISRCERLNFKRVSVSDTVKKLQIIVDQEGLIVDKDVLTTIARHSGGYLRDAESVLGQVISLSDSKEIKKEQVQVILPQSDLSLAVKYVDYLSDKNTSKAIELINNLMDSGVDLNNFISDLLQVLRKIIIEKVNPGLSQSLGLDFGENLEKEILDLKSKLEISQVSNFVDIFIKTSESIKSSQITQLPLELATIKVCKQKDSFNRKSDDIDDNNKVVNTKKEESSKPNTVDNWKNSSISTNSYNKFKTKDLDVKAEKEDNISEINIKEEKTNIKIEDIQSKWKEFILKIKKQNHSLVFILQNCWPGDIEDGCINLKCKYKFHQERLNDFSIKDLIEKTIQDLFKAKIRFKTSLVSDLEVPSLSSNDDKLTKNKSKEEIKEKSKTNEEQKGVLNNILDAFGGEVIN